MVTDDLRKANEAMVSRLLFEAEAEPGEGGYSLRVLETTGRRSGRRTLTPLGVLRYGGQRYLVSPDRTRDWVRNLQACAEASVRAGGARWDVRAVPVEGDGAADVVAAYLDAVQVPWARAAFAGPAAPGPEP